MRATSSWRLPSAFDGPSAFDRFPPFCGFRGSDPQRPLYVDSGRPLCAK